jgi:uncharacterized protein (TIGR03437 family)
VQPAIFTNDNIGTGQGKIYLVAADGSPALAAPGGPAHASDTVTIQATGLGAVNMNVTAGSAAPSAPPGVHTEFGHCINRQRTNAGCVRRIASGRSRIV